MTQKFLALRALMVGATTYRVGDVVRYGEPEPPIPPRTVNEWVRIMQWLDLRAKMVDDAPGVITIRVSRDAAILLTMWLSPMRPCGLVVAVVGDLRWWECRIDRCQFQRGKHNGM